MTIVVVHEMDSLSWPCWEDRLKVSPTQMSDLVTRKIFDESPDGRLTLKFVGFLIFRRHAVAAVPKYWSSGSSPVSFLVRVLRTYFSRLNRRSIDATLLELHYRDVQAMRELDGVYTLLRWFGERGVYVRHTRKKAIALGRTDWNRTFVQSVAVFSGTSVIYPQTVLISRTSLTNEISALQLALTVALLKKYSMQVPNQISEAAAALPLSFDPLSSDARSYFLPLLVRERATTYRTDDLSLLMTLEALLSGDDGLSGKGGANLYGTSAFYAIWEDGCRAWLRSGISDYTLGHAVWNIYKDRMWAKSPARNDQRPDLVLTKGSDTWIVDAKYYHPFPESRPGWQDIVKQLYYAESIARPPSGEVHNIFLIPNPDTSELQYAGLVVLEGGPRSFPAIEVWLANPDHVFSSYGSSSEVEARMIFDRFITTRNEMIEVAGNPNGNIRLE